MPKIVHVKQNIRRARIFFSLYAANEAAIYSHSIMSESFLTLYEGHAWHANSNE